MLMYLINADMIKNSLLVKYLQLTKTYDSASKRILKILNTFHCPAKYKQNRGKNCLDLDLPAYIMTTKTTRVI